MVAIVDMEAGRAERERMVTLAVEQGWIQKVLAWAADRGHPYSVAVLATHDAKAPGPLGKILKRAVAELGHLRQTRRAQLAAGVRPYVVFSLPLAGLCQMVDEGTAEDLRTYAARDQYAALCLNADKEVLISGVSPDRKEG